MITTVEAYEHCTRVTRDRAKNFAYGLLLLPKEARGAMCAVYAFCRACDDAVDEPDTPEQKREALDALRTQLVQALAGRPEGPIFIALMDAKARYGIPPEYFHGHLEAFRMDMERMRYATFEELREYCYGVASLVGLMCLHIFGFSSPDAKVPAVDLGIAMQLVNIIRDVKEDADRGRIYLPQDELARHGVSEEQVLRGEATDGFRALMGDQAARAKEFFERSRALYRYLPKTSRKYPRFLHAIYGRTLEEIEREGYPVLSRRVELSKLAKVRVALGVWLGSLWQGQPAGLNGKA